MDSRLIYRPYSRKSFVVRLNYQVDMDPVETAYLVSDIRELGGSYNPRLKGGPGWIFPLFKLNEFENYLHTGQMYGYRRLSRIFN